MKKMLKYWVLGALALAIVFGIGFNSWDSKLKASEDDGTTTAQEQQRAKEESSKKVEVVVEKKEEPAEHSETKDEGKKEKADDEEEYTSYETEEEYTVDLGGDDLPYDGDESEVVLVAEDVIGAEAGYIEEEVLSEEEILCEEEVLSEEDIIEEEEIIEEEASEPVEVEIKMDADGDIYYGDNITLRADVKGTPNDGYRLVWQCKAAQDADWEEIGEGVTYRFVVTEENEAYEYRVILVH